MARDEEDSDPESSRPELALAAGLPRQRAPSVQAGPICPLSALKPGPTKVKSRRHTPGLCGRTPGSPGHVLLPDAAQAARPSLAWAWSKLPSLQDQKTPVRVTSGVLNKTALQGFKEGLRDAAARTHTVHTKPHLSENGHLSRGLPRANSMASV